MATVSISKWEIAKMFGLTLDCEQNVGGQRIFVYDFHGKPIVIPEWSDEDANEDAAEIVLTAIGKVAAGVL